MSNPNTQQLVDRGLKIIPMIDALQKELKTIAKQLEAAALDGVKMPLQEADREGQKFLARGSEMIVPVILESDLICQSFAEGGETHQAITRALGDEYADKLNELFKPVSKLELIASDGQKYRRKLRELLPPETAALVLHASLSRDKKGIPKSRTVIAWDDAQVIDQPTAETIISAIA